MKPQDHVTKVRVAMLLAADHIERNPQLYAFNSYYVPLCGSKGCMLGWIGFFLNMSGGESRTNNDVKRFIGVELFGWYDLMREKYGLDDFNNHKTASESLRRFATEWQP